EKLAAIVGAALVRSLVKRTPGAGSVKREIDALLAQGPHREALREYMKTRFGERRAQRLEAIASLPASSRPATPSTPPLASVVVAPGLYELALDRRAPAMAPAPVHDPSAQSTPLPLTAEDIEWGGDERRTPPP